MKCPFCGVQETKVIDSRPADDNSSIRRRRQCESCGKRFTTYEKIETIPLIVIKEDNNREPYDRGKIEKGILRSCNKRPISGDQINALLNDIETEIFQYDAREIPAQRIGEIVMQALFVLDHVAYVRFASVYQDFQDVEAFRKHIAQMQQIQDTGNI